MDRQRGKNTQRIDRGRFDALPAMPPGFGDLQPDVVKILAKDMDHRKSVSTVLRERISKLTGSRIDADNIDDIIRQMGMFSSTVPDAAMASLARLIFAVLTSGRMCGETQDSHFCSDPRCDNLKHIISSGPLTQAFKSLFVNHDLRRFSTGGVWNFIRPLDRTPWPQLRDTAMIKTIIIADAIVKHGGSWRRTARRPAIDDVLVPRLRDLSVLSARHHDWAGREVVLWAAVASPVPSGSSSPSTFSSGGAAGNG